MQPDHMTTKGVKRWLASLGVKQPTKQVVEETAKRVRSKERRGGVTHYWEFRCSEDQIRAAVAVCAGVPPTDYVETFIQALS